MNKRLLATTAAIALFVTPMAYAQDASNADVSPNAPVFTGEQFEGTGPVDGFYSADPHQVLATRFIGANIHSGAGEEAETIGDVNDIIMTPDGRAVAVIAGVGGFLGIGEKEVAVSIDELAWMTAEDGDMVLVTSLTKEQLENAPDFDRAALDADAQTAMDGTQSRVPTNDAVAADETMPKVDDKMADDKMAANDDMTQATDDTIITASTPKMETVPAAEADLKADTIIGMSVIDAENETIGEVGDILIDEGGKVEAFIVDVGGFLGINEKPVAVSFDELQFARAEGSSDWTAIKTGLTKDALENHKAYTEGQYESDKDSVILIAPVE